MVLGYGIHYPIRHGQVENWVRGFESSLADRRLMQAGSYGEILVELHF